MRHMASHDIGESSTTRVRVKGEPSNSDDVEENYVVVEVIQGAEEQYEDEATDLELEDELGEEMEEIVEENDNYTLTESKRFIQSFMTTYFSIIELNFTDIDSDVIMSMKNSPQAGGSLSFGFSDEDDDDDNSKNWNYSLT